jgi:hypothetical protein
VLDQREGVANVGLGLGVLALVLLVEEGRKGDRGEDADDDEDYRDLDQREPGLVMRQAPGTAKAAAHAHFLTFSACDG